MALNWNAECVVCKQPYEKREKDKGECLICEAKRIRSQVPLKILPYRNRLEEIA